MKKLLVILLFLPQILFCQLSDNFEDGDFTSNPSWNGSTDQFIVNSNFQLQLNALAEGNAYLTSTYSSQGITEWHFFIKLSFSPSGNNFARVFLSSDPAEAPLPPTPFAVNEAATQQPIAGWFHDPTAWPTVLFFGIALIVIRIVAGFMTRRGRRRIFVYPIAFGIFIPTLFLFFGGLARLLPANL